MKKINLFGENISVKDFKGFDELFNKDNKTDGFEIYYQNKSAFRAYSNKTYHHNGQGAEFDYKYGIIAEYIVESNSVIYSLVIVPTGDSLYPDNLDRVKMENDYVEGYASKPIDVMDICEAGYSCTIVDNMKNYNDYTEIEDSVLLDIANAVSAIDPVHEKYLDRCNDIENVTGWDLLDNYIYGESIEY